ncbi:hypothetical protein [Burkholderia vietnamiensis]|uniref:hypothetical protein n=1 Tax=Burkholderia vietnamiensis TaxID=60552 RepID=UPI0007584A84|nr:hypothetical protein [Burkholderia vietnamiensis]KVE70721.1 hypothetical protein WI97_04145 [Burkholderia vietnamiensis]
MDKRKIVCWLLALAVCGQAEAGTVLVFDKAGKIVSTYVDQTTAYSYGKMQTETSGLLYKKLGSMGLEVTDVRVTKTIQAVETVATGAANGARSGIGGGWIGIVVGAVIGAVVNWAIGLGLDKLVKWRFGSGDSVTATTSASAPPIGSFYYFALEREWPDTCGQRIEKDYLTDVEAFNADSAASKQTPVSCYGTDPSKTMNWQLDSCDGRGNCTAHATSWVDGSTLNSTFSYNYQYGVPVNLQVSSGGDGSPVTTDIATATKNVPDSEKAQPVNPELAASTVNALWQQASQLSGYQGVPYDPSNPVTTQDATDWQDANPSYTPTVGDALGVGSGSGTQGQSGVGGSLGSLPIHNTPGSSDPTPGVNPGTGSGTGSGTGTGTGTGSSGSQCGAPGQPPCEVDFGANPNTPQPSLENTPTIQMILGPIFNMLPGFNSFQVPAHTGVCPTATFAMFGRSYTMDQHCTLFEQNRTAINAMFAMVFVLASVFIVLSA